MLKCPCTGKVINADLNGTINIPHIPESLRTVGRGLPAVRDRGDGLKARPAVYRWTNGAGWVIPASNEGEGCKPQTNGRPRGALALKGGEEVSIGGRR